MSREADPPTTEALADRMFAAIEAGDIDALGACYQPEMTAWTNFDDRTHTRERALKTVGWLCSHVSEIRYDVKRREILEDGFMQQHVLRGRTTDGSELAVPACVVARVEDGLVAHMDEYLDLSAFDAVAGG